MICKSIISDSPRGGLKPLRGGKEQQGYRKLDGEKGWNVKGTGIEGFFFILFFSEGKVQIEVETSVSRINKPGEMHRR